MKELGSPIELEAVKSLSARYTFKAMGLITVQLKWDIQKDDRVVYRIYEKKDGKDKLLDSVKGKGSFDIPYANLFSGASYKVVPYNSQTNQEGEERNTFSRSFFFLIMNSAIFEH